MARERVERNSEKLVRMLGHGCVGRLTKEEQQKENILISFAGDLVASGKTKYSSVFENEDKDFVKEKFRLEILSFLYHNFKNTSVDRNQYVISQIILLIQTSGDMSTHFLNSFIKDFESNLDQYQHWRQRPEEWLNEVVRSTGNDVSAIKRECSLPICEEYTDNRYE